MFVVNVHSSSYLSVVVSKAATQMSTRDATAYLCVALSKHCISRTKQNKLLKRMICIYKDFSLPSTLSWIRIVSIIPVKGSSCEEIKARIGLATAIVARLTLICKTSNTSLATKIKLLKSLVAILTYGCESWALNTDTERRLQASEMKCLQRMLKISNREHRTNEYV